VSWSLLSEKETWSEERESRSNALLVTAIELFWDWNPPLAVLPNILTTKPSGMNFAVEVVVAKEFHCHLI